MKDPKNPSVKAQWAAGGFIAAVFGYVLFCAGLAIGVIWAAVHFIRKFW